nr:zinc finger BED domain-containing protein 1-like [Leptinotarsa decemlineata]
MRPGPKKTSSVWEHFNKISDRSVKCNICNKTLKFFGNTTNLNQHLKRIHPTLTLSSTNKPTSNMSFITGNENERDTLDSRGQDLSTGTGPSAVADKENTRPTSARLVAKSGAAPPKLFGATSAELGESEIKNIDRALIKMITNDYQPLSIVEDKGFIEYSNLLRPQYKLPNRKKLSNDILPSIYAEQVEELKLLLNDTSSVSVTTDIWTSDSNRGYITVTCHFIYNDEFHSHVLSTEEIIGNHSGELISTVLSDIFNIWNISNKIITIVSDNGSNIKCAINDFLQKHHHPCVAHTLNLSVTDALNSNPNFQGIVKKFKTIVGHFSHSVLACNKLKSVQEQMGFPVLKLKQDVSTRWNSTLIMLERLVKVKDALSMTIISITKAPEFLDADEWAVIEDSIFLLKPLEVMTATLFADTYPTISMVIPLVRGLQHSLVNWKSKTDICETLRKNLIDTIARRLGILECNKIISKATFLDPRFKKLAFGNDINANNAQIWVSEELTSLINEKNQVPTGVDEVEFQSKPQDLDTNRNCDIWSHFDNKVAKAKSITTPLTIVTLMIRQYLEMPYYERKSNPMEFWKTHKSTFPELYKLALKYLSIPVTSVPSERVFSKTGQLTNLRRNRLPPKHLDEIIFFNSI